MKMGFSSLLIIVFVNFLTVSASGAESPGPAPSSTSVAPSAINPADPAKENHGIFPSPDQINSQIRSQIAHLNIGQDAKLLDLDLNQWVNLAVKYRYQLEPSYQGSWYTRTDKWTLDTTVNSGDLLPDAVIGVSIGLSKDSQVVFARQFKSELDAAKAIPYTPEKLPVRASIVRDKLNPGDFASFQTTMNLVVSASVLQAAGALNISEELHYIVSGQFQVRIFKKDDKWARIQIVTVASQGEGGSVSIGLANPIQITGFGIVNKALKHVTITPLSIGVNFSKNSLTMLDYVIDLSNPAVQDAYNKIFDLSLPAKDILVAVDQFKDSNTGAPFARTEYLSDFTPMLQIFKDDLCKKDADRRVRRIKEGEIVSNSESIGFQVQLQLLKISGSSSVSQNNIVFKHGGSDDIFDHYRLDSRSSDTSTQLLFVDQKHANISANVLYETDENFKVLKNGFSDFGGFFDMKNTITYGKQIREVVAHVKTLVGEKIAGQIPWGNWDKAHLWNVWGNTGDLINAHLTHQIYFHKNSMVALESYCKPETCKDVFTKGFTNYINHLPDGAITVSPNVPTASGQGAPADIPSKTFSLDIMDIRNYLADAADPTKDDTYRAERFEKLWDIPLFRNVGTGFLVSILPQGRLGEFLHFSMNWSAKSIDPLVFDFPKDDPNSKSELYSHILSMQTALYDQGIDLRAENYNDAPAEGACKLPPAPPTQTP